MLLLHGDSRVRLGELPDCSVDSVVCDPPYELGFMGKSWDASGVAYDVDLWGEVLRVLKPGGHLLAFGGSRTYHRLACAVEDAGFEIRDQIMWVYGSGFPKSLDVSKAIDKMDARDEQQARRYRFTEWVRSTGLTSAQIDGATKTSMGGHYTTAASQPAIMTMEHLNAVRHLIDVVPDWVEAECRKRSVESRNFAEREVVGTKESTQLEVAPGEGRDRPPVELNVTAPATADAAKWSGWGTALKPAHEPIVVARKQLVGTVAGNVLEWGVGAINIDGCRVGSDGGTTKGNPPKEKSNGIYGDGINGACDIVRLDAGRWPANLIHDGSDEVLTLFPDTTSKSGGRSGTNANPMSWSEDNRTRERGGHDDSGSAARFFYCAKAGKKERNAGLDGFDDRRQDEDDYERAGTTNPRNRSQALRKNHHPTVKPITLMRYLCRLVTPPSGTVLDPFLGSGTTGIAATLEGFDFIGIEQDAEYLAIAEARIKHHTPKG